MDGRFIHSIRAGDMFTANMSANEITGGDMNGQGGAFAHRKNGRSISG